MTQVNLSDELAAKLLSCAAQRGVSLEVLLDQWADQFLTDTAQPLSPESASPSASHDYYQAIFTHARDAILIIDNEFRYVDANPAACALLGYTREEMLQLSAWDITPPENQVKMAMLVEQARQEKGVFAEYTMRRKDGTNLTGEFLTVQNILPGLHLAIVRDITERNNIMQALRRSEQMHRETSHFLQTVFAGVQSSIFVVNVDETGDFRFGGMNPAHERATTLSNENLIGRRPEEVVGIDPEVAAVIRANYQRCVEAGEPITYEEMSDVNGHQQWWLTQLTPLKNEDDRVYRIIGCSLNITEQRQMAEALLQVEESKYRLNVAEIELAKERELREFQLRVLSMITHEFKTPLSIILTSVDLLRRHSTSREYLDDRLTRIAQQVGHLNRMVDDLGYMKNNEIHHYRLQHKTLNVRTFLEGLIHEIGDPVKDAIQISLSLSGDGVEYSLDTELLRQIMVNLLTNAVKYSKPSGQVYVEGILSPEEIVMTVEDNGIGIPPENQAHLFDLFYRGSNVGLLPGTGVGLAIVKQAVEAHGGSIQFTSEVNVGTRFVVRFPARNVANATT